MIRIPWICENEHASTSRVSNRIRKYELPQTTRIYPLRPIKIEFLPSRELGGEQGAALTTYPHKLSPIFGVLAMGVHLLLGTPMSSCN